jgi:DNA-binding transcriptional regulator YiaG
MKPEELKAWRKQADDGKKITQREASRIFGVSPRTFCYWESGEIVIPGPAERLVQIFSRGGIPEWIRR